LIDNEVTFAACCGPDGGEDEAASLFIERETFGRRACPEDAQYVIVNGTLTGAASGFLASRLNPGTLLYPEDGATLVLDVERICQAFAHRPESDEEAKRPSGAAGLLNLRMVGPGVPGSRSIRVRGAQAPLIEARNRLCAEYPMGIDVVLVTDDGTMAAIPRTTRLIGEGGK
jgi:alpha-D-ribose 1-methylphosphonate 5-triphosphate synthase subunit PhnH